MLRLLLRRGSRLLSGGRGSFLSAVLGVVLLLRLAFRCRAFVGSGDAVRCVGLCAGIRVTLARFKRCPCAGRHLLFFAAAKKSRQKKAAHTASPCSYPRAPNVPILHTVMRGPACVANALSVHLTRFMYPRRSTPRQAVRRRPGGKLCVGCRAPQVSALTRNTNPATSPE